MDDYQLLDEVIQDLKGLVFGSFLGEGATRKVYDFNPLTGYVIKVAKNPRGASEPCSVWWDHENNKPKVVSSSLHKSKSNQTKRQAMKKATVIGWLPTGNGRPAVKIQYDNDRIVNTRLGPKVEPGYTTHNIDVKIGDKLELYGNEDGLGYDKIVVNGVEVDMTHLQNLTAQDLLVEPKTGEMYMFVLTHALKFLTEEQRTGLCFDLYARSKSTQIIDRNIEQLKKASA